MAELQRVKQMIAGRREQEKEKIDSRVNCEACRRNIQQIAEKIKA